MEQRRIVVTVLEDKQANSVVFAESNLCIGYAGEHLATILGFNLPENWLNQSAKYQICFRTSDGKCYSTDLLDIPELALPSGVMVEGALYVQVLATDSDGTVIKKTEVCKCTVGKSIADGEIIAKYDGVKLVSQLTEELQAAIEAAEEARGNLMSSVATAAGVKTGVESATKSANTAKTNLQSATSVANTAKTSLETATENANTAKTNLETAITNAATATTSANNAAASANSASTAATNAASAANTAAENLQADISDANGKLSAINEAISDLQTSTSTNADNISEIYDVTTITITSKNLLNINDADFLTNKIIAADGSEVENANNSTTGFIECNNGDTIIVGSATGIGKFLTRRNATYVALYDKNKTFLSKTAQYPFVDYLYTISDERAKYFRVVDSNSFFEKEYIMIAKSTTSLMYEEFFEPYKQLKNQSDIDIFKTEIEKLQQSAIKKYSVSFSGSLSAGTRLDDAVGMRADVQIGTDASGVVNDFDNVSFFNRPVCCCSWDSSNRKWRVNAYEGEPGFTRDGSNGEVMYECTPFWYKADFEGEGAPHYISVTGTPCEGYTLAPMFKNGYDKVYCSSYWMSMVDGKPTSRNGVYGTYGSLDSLMTNARTFDDKAHLETIEMLFSDYLLMLVEFATKDLQTVMIGANSMRCDQEDVVNEVSTGGAATNIRMENCDISNYVVGQTICVGTAKNGENRVLHARVVSVNGGGTITNLGLDTAETAIEVGDYVSSRPWINGATDIITASSGTVANDGKHPCIWRGKVDPWADAFSMICNLLVKQYGDGSEDNQYSYRLQYLTEPWKYVNGGISADYIEANFNLATTSGYVKTVSSDSRYPYIIGTTEVGGTSTNYAAAYYSAPKEGVKIVRYGGAITNARACSPVYFSSGTQSPSAANWSTNARLFVPHN